MSPQVWQDEDTCRNEGKHYGNAEAKEYQRREALVPSQVRREPAIAAFEHACKNPFLKGQLTYRPRLIRNTCRIDVLISNHYVTKRDEMKHVEVSRINIILLG